MLLIFLINILCSVYVFVFCKISKLVETPVPLRENVFPGNSSTAIILYESKYSLNILVFFAVLPKYPFGRIINIIPSSFSKLIARSINIIPISSLTLPFPSVYLSNTSLFLITVELPNGGFKQQ